MARGRVRVTDQSTTGRNVRFRDTARHLSMSRADFVRRIERGEYPDYHVRRVNRVKTPVSGRIKTGQCGSVQNRPFMRASFSPYDSPSLEHKLCL